MEHKARNSRRADIFPAIVTAIIAGMLGVAVSGGVVVLLRFQPQPVPVLAPVTMAALIALPIMMIAVSWFSVRYATHIVSKQAVANARGHAAVARLVAVGMGRLAQGDTVARINIKLPQPYENLARDFNMIAQTLQSARDEATMLCQQIESHATALDEAALRLGNRARKLSTRVEADLKLIATLEETSPIDALGIARNTLQGTSIAAQRNLEAADMFATIGPLLRQESQTVMATVMKEAIILPAIAA